MEAAFLRVLNMSLTASYVILAVLVLRLLLRRAPKKYSYLLWGVVGFRLLCPFSFSSVVSLFNVLALPKRAVSGPAINYIPPDIAMAPAPTLATGVSQADTAINAALPPASPATSANPMQIWLFIAAAVWLLCVAVLLLYASLSLWQVHRQVRTAVRTGRGVWECGGIRSPFILGLFRPRIYLPFGLGEEERSYILAHERCHLRRHDHWVKVLSFLLLAVHWFNPLVWLAFLLMTRDMEMSCDEAVLAQNGPGLKRAYSTSLLSFAANRRMAFPTPLAFGETGVKARIRNVLKYKPARKWAAVLAGVLCLALVAACVANPVAEGEGEDYERFGIRIPLPAAYDGQVELADPDSLPDDVLLAAYHTASQESTEGGAEDGWGGWMFSIVRHDYASFEDYWVGRDLSGGSQVFARDGRYYYSREVPTDVQFAPSLYEEYDALLGAFDLDAVIEANGLEPWTESPWGDISAYTYPGNHWEFYGDTCSLILSQPVRQGEGGIWCAERWSDSYGGTHLVLPDTDLTALEYYGQLQAAVDAGEAPLQTPYEVAADYVANVLGQPIGNLVGYELAEGAKGEAFSYLGQLFTGDAPSIWYRDGAGDSRFYALSDSSPNQPGGNWYLSRYKILFNEFEWERLESPVTPGGNLLCLGRDASHCFVFHLGTEYVSIVSGEERISYRTPLGMEDIFASNLPDAILREYSGYEINAEDVSVPAVEGESFEAAMDRWLAAYREHLLNTIPESTYALADMAVVEREIFLTREGDGGIFGFWADTAVKPAMEDWGMSPWWAGNTSEGEGEWAGWMVMSHEYRLERIDGAWYCTSSGTGGLSLDEG